MPVRRCLDCGTLTARTRCGPCGRTKRNERYGGDWRHQSKTAIVAHLAEHGPVCPGWRRPSHEVAPDDLTLDHEAGVMCRACNVSKRRRGDG